MYRGDENAIALTARYNWLNFYPNSTQAVDLYDVQIGASYTHQMEGKKSWSVSTSFGSASDKPFEDSSVNTVSVTGLYSFPGSETGRWLLLLNYSNNRPILNNIPLPGFAYTYTPSKTFRGTFGIPFASIHWQFIDQWSLTLFTVAPWIAKAQVAYSIVGPVQVFTGIDFSQMTYLQYGRSNPKERLYFDEKKLFAGVKSPLSRIIYAELEAGYSFGRRIFLAETYTTNPANPTELGSSWYGRVTISATY